MKTFIKLHTKVGIFFIVYSYLIISVTEVFNLNHEDKTLSFFLLRIGLVGLCFFIIKLVKKLLIQTGQTYKEQDLTTEIVNDETENYVKIAFIIGSFMLHASTISSIAMLFKGYDALNHLNVYEFVGMFIYSVIMTVIFKKWGYDDAMEVVEKNF